MHQVMACECHDRSTYAQLTAPSGGPAIVPRRYGTKCTLTKIGRLLAGSVRLCFGHVDPHRWRGVALAASGWGERRLDYRGVSRQCRDGAKASKLTTSWMTGGGPRKLLREITSNQFCTHHTHIHIYI